MRSLFAFFAAAWFAWQAINYAAPALGTGVAIDVASAAFSVTDAVRTLSIGLAFMSLALAEWDRISRLLGSRVTGSGPVD